MQQWSLLGWDCDLYLQPFLCCAKHLHLRPLLLQQKSDLQLYAQSTWIHLYWLHCVHRHRNLGHSLDNFTKCHHMQRPDRRSLRVLVDGSHPCGNGLRPNVCRMAYLPRSFMHHSDLLLYLLKFKKGGTGKSYLKVLAACTNVGTSPQYYKKKQVQGFVNSRQRSKFVHHLLREL